MKIDSKTMVEEVKESKKTTLENMCFIKHNEEKNTLANHIRQTMRLRTVRPSFSEYDFIRLFFAIVRINGQTFIDRDSLRYDLYEFYNNEEYKELFQDIAIKQQIEGNYLDIEEALQNAVLYGVLSAHDSNPYSSTRLILMDSENCSSIINGYDKNYVQKMNDLTINFLENKSGTKSEKYYYKGKVKSLKNKSK